MLYAHITKNQIKLFYLKKNLLGRYEALYFEKKHEIDLLDKGRAKNVDVLASALKEGLTSVLPQGHEKQVYLVLPQDSFSFFNAEVPKNITPSAIDSFARDKAKTIVSLETENYFYDYFLREVNDQKQVNFFAINEDTLNAFDEVFKLLGLKLLSVLPESLAIFKLFEKTLRPEKKENILFAHYSDDIVWGYLYDTGGLLVNEKWAVQLAKDTTIQEAIKAQKEKFEKHKLNRIILSGDKSEKIRQDTFTKDVGVWTNPLKRIIPNFYQDYLKMLIVASDKGFPLLAFDVCFGAFIFISENKDFQMLKKPLRGKKRKGLSMPKVPIFKKEVLIFLVSAIASFLIFFGLSKMNFNGFKLPNPLPQKPTPTVVKKPTPTVAPKIVKSEIKIKVLNGSGTAGKASDVKDVLVEKGYQEILTGNADNFDYTTTVIRAKDPKVANVLEKDLADSVSSPKVERLSASENSDVIIIVGSDFK